MSTNHEAEVHILGDATIQNRAGLHAQAAVNIVVPASATFSTLPPKKMTVDSSKVIVQKG